MYSIDDHPTSKSRVVENCGFGCLPGIWAVFVIAGLPRVLVYALVLLFLENHSFPLGFRLKIK